MTALLSLLCFLLVMVAGEGRKLLSGKDTTMMVPGPMAKATAYWKTVLPNSPIPSAILDLLTPPSGKQKKKSSVLKLNPKLDQTKKKFPHYNYGNPIDEHDHVHYDSHNDNRMIFNYEVVKIKIENLDMYQYRGANGINEKPELDLANKNFSHYNYGNQVDEHDHIQLAKKKFSHYIYGNSGDERDHVLYDGRSENKMVLKDGTMMLKKENSYLYQYSGVNRINEKLELDLGKKKFLRYIYGNPRDAHDLVHLAKKKFSRYIYGNPKVGHDHVHYDGHSDNMLFKDASMKLKKEYLDLYWYNGANGINKKPKLDLAKNKFSRYIYGSLVDGHGYVHLANKKFSSYNYGNPIDGHDYVHRDGHRNNHIVLNKEAMKLRKKTSNWYRHNGQKEI